MKTKLGATKRGKVLMICKANVGRSQIAEAFFNRFSEKNTAISAGSYAENYPKYLGKKLTKFAQDIVKIMKEEGINISQKLPKQLTKKMVDEADKIIVLHVEKLPDYVNMKKVIRWDVQDLNHLDHETQQKYRDEIKKRVLELVKEIG